MYKSRRRCRESVLSQPLEILRTPYIPSTLSMGSLPAAISLLHHDAGITTLPSSCLCRSFSNGGAVTLNHFYGQLRRKQTQLRHPWNALYFKVLPRVELTDPYCHSLRLEMPVLGSSHRSLFFIECGFAQPLNRGSCLGAFAEVVESPE